MKKRKFMPYADDIVRIFFGLGVAIILGVVAVFLLFGLFGWASLGFLGTGILVSVSFYFIGQYPSLGSKDSEVDRK